MEIDKVEYNGRTTNENDYFVHYDRQRQRVLSRIDILIADVDKENKVLKLINKKIDELNKSRGESNQLQHALNVPAEVCCSKKGILFQYKQGSISDNAIEVMIDYDDLEPYLTEDFKQLMNGNDNYKLFDDKIKPEPINATQAAPKPAETTVKKTSTYQPKSGYEKKKYNSKSNKYQYKRQYKYRHKKKRYSKPAQTSLKSYSGAKRKSGRYGRSGRRSWSHRRR
jgi:hypothetical protein